MQNRKSANAHIVYFAFYILMLEGKDPTKLPLSKRRELLRSAVKPSDHVTISEWASSAENLLVSSERISWKALLPSAQTAYINQASARDHG